MPSLVGVQDKRSAPRASKGVLGRAAALALVPMAFAGCGGSKSKSAGGTKSESAEVASVAHRYYAALASGNGSEFCSLLTGETREELIKEIQSVYRIQGRQANNLTCPLVVKTLREGIRQDQIAGLKQAKVTVVSLSGNSATVSVTLSIAGRSRATAVTLSKTAAGWLISKLPSVSPGTAA
jgi:hypothetical protein